LELRRLTVTRFRRREGFGKDSQIATYWIKRRLTGVAILGQAPSVSTAG
jgi:hypothetical protein